MADPQRTPSRHTQEPVMPRCLVERSFSEWLGLEQDAAAAWRALGCPFETTRALAQGDELRNAKRLRLSKPSVLGRWSSA